MKIRNNNVIQSTKLLRYPIDYSLLWVALILLAFGLIMIFSATITSPKYGPYSTIIKQFTYAISVGFFCYIVASKIPMSFYNSKFSMWFILFIISLLLILCTMKFSGYGSINGAVRWLKFGPLTIQPSELFKIATILYLSCFFIRKKDIINNKNKSIHIRSLVGMLLPAVGLLAILYTKDLGSFAVIIGIILSMYMLTRTFFRYIIYIAIGCAMTALCLIIFDYERTARIITYLHRSDIYGNGYQVTLALESIANGGLFGQGLAQGQKSHRIPEVHTDFIFSLIYEEIGLIGITIFCLTYAWLIWKTGSIASLAEKSKQYFSYYVANGILFMFASQLTIHILVNLGLLPNKGLTLPLISYGGSSLFVSMFSIAILLRIDYENRRQLLGGYR